MSFDTPENWERLWNTFHQAREAGPEERNFILKTLQHTDPEFCKSVQELLQAEQNAGQKLEALIADELDFWSSAIKREEDHYEPGDLLMERFRIQRHLGKGGMGDVYEALDLDLGVTVGLKLMRTHISADATARDRFHREIALARKITHHNACRIFDLFRHEDLLFLTMELLQGETLHQKIRREGRISPATALPILKQIADAMTAIHEAGIIHRDLKSSNVLLVPQMDGFRVVVTDFGLAVPVLTEEAEPVTVTGQVLGTPQFMAPEQLMRGNISSRSDIYAFGLIAFELITGRLPHSGEPLLTIAAKRISEPSPSPKTIVPDLPTNWERAILKCLERDPQKRFPTANEFVKSLESNSLTRHLPHVFTRNPLPSFFAGVFFLLLVSAFWFGRSEVAPQLRSQEVSSKRLWKGSTGLPAGIVSTDGKTLIDIDWQTADILAIDLHSGTKRRVTQSKLWFLPQKFVPYPILTAISRDGKQVAYSLAHEWDSGCDLQISFTNGSNSRRVFTSKTSCADPVDWSTDSQKLLVRFQDRKGAHIAVLEIKSGQLQIVKSLESPTVRKMIFSPDGRFVLYDNSQDQDSTNHDLFLLSLGDGTHQRLVRHKANDYVLGWAPDGSKILFASDRSGTYDAWSTTATRGNERGIATLIRKDIGQIYPLAITGDGSLYYAHLISSRDVFTGTLDRKTAAKITYGVPGSNGGADFSPDGKHMLIQTAKNPVANRWIYSPPAELALLNLNSDQEKPIDHPLQHISGYTRFSPDGESILIYGDDGRSGLGVFRIHLPTGESMQVVADPSHSFVRYADWAGSNSAIFYLFNKGGEIWHKNIENGTAKKITTDAASFAASKDGLWLAILSYDVVKGTAAVDTFDVTKRKKQRILNLKLPDYISALTWSPDDQTVIFSTGRRDSIDQPHVLWKIAARGGPPVKLGIETDYVHDVRIHPDGKRFAISTFTDTSEIWVMENFLQQN
jgi:serine/threonine protein kinase